MSSTPIVKMYRNPWPHSVADGVVLQFLMTAATEAADRLQELYEEDWPEGRLPSERDSFAAVLLDPVRTRGATNFLDRLFASVEIGPDAARYLPNGGAKADAHDRLGKPNGFFVDQANFCLGDHDFAWGSSAEYNGAIGGGSGLFPSQDAALTSLILESVMCSVHDYRKQRVEEWRKSGSHGWYNPDNNPHSDYIFFPNIPAVTLAHSA